MPSPKGTVIIAPPLRRLKMRIIERILLARFLENLLCTPQVNEHCHRGYTGSKVEHEGCPALFRDASFFLP